MCDSNLKKPSNHCFASGPVNKLFRWNVDNKDIISKLNLLGRSHRSKDFLVLSQGVVSKVKKLLNIPKDYKIVTMTGGATGAVEMAIWNLLGYKPLDCLSWECFGDIWYNEIVNQLKVPNVILHKSEFGEYPSLDKVNFKQNDLLFVYSGSTSGVIFKDEVRIPVEREGIVVSDATSYLFMYDVPWEKLDAVAFSWQKVLAGEAAHGMLVLSPKAIDRLIKYTPRWPIPKLFKLKDNNGNLLEEFFNTGICLNTPSTLAFIDVNYNLDWIINNGGVSALKKKINNNYEVLKNWVEQTPWIKFLVKDESYRSKAIACLVISDAKWHKLSLLQQQVCNQFMLNYLDSLKIASDISMYRLSPVIGFRIWLGPTIAESDVALLTQWLNVAYNKMKTQYYT